MSINKGRVSLLVAGVLLGIFIFASPSIILSFLILAGLYFFIITRKHEDRVVLAKVVAIAMVLRMLFLGIALGIVYSRNAESIGNYPFLNKVIGHTTQLVRDFDREIQNGDRIMRYLKGEFGDVPMKTVSVGGHGRLHSGAWVQGVLNLVFGKSVFNFLIFPMLDLWAVIFIYYIGRYLFGRHTAAFGSAIYAVMPSAVFIACTNIRFSVGIFFFFLMSLSIVMFSRANKPVYILTALASMFLFAVFKDKSTRVIFFITPILLFLALNIKPKLKFASSVVLICLAALLTYKSPVLQSKAGEIIKAMVGYQKGFVTEARVHRNSSVYKIYDEFVYLQDLDYIPVMSLVKMLPRAAVKGTTYFIFSPFPWKVRNVTRLYAYPFLLAWYIIIGFAFLGIIKSLFLGRREILIIALLCGYLILVLSLVLGNQGIAARYRELVAPFFYIFAGFALFGTRPDTAKVD